MQIIKNLNKLNVFNEEFNTLYIAFTPRYIICYYTGTISDVKGTPFDLTTPTQLRERMKDVLVSNYVFEGHGKKKHVAK